MHIKSIKTHKILENETLESIIDKYIGGLNEGDILAITSKIVSLCQGRIINKSSISKHELIMKEADQIVRDGKNSYDIYLTIKDNILIPSAGIDESNSNDTYILYPKNVQSVAISVWQYLKAKFSLKNLGIIITDSHTTPMRWGVTGISLGWCGFEPLYSYVDQPDVFGKKMRVTKINLLDALATSAVLMMGEGDEQTPLALISSAPKISFLDRPPSPEEEKSVILSMKDDIYAPLLTSVDWKTSHSI